MYNGKATKPKIDLRFTCVYLYHIIKMATHTYSDISSVLGKFDDRMNSIEFTPIIPKLESYMANHIIFIDNRPIHLVRFLPYVDPISGQTLFTIQYIYLNEHDHISFQLTVTKNGHGYSSSGRKYNFKCIKKEEYYCV